MKLICVDTDNCGFFSYVEDLEDPDHQNICPDCFGLAIEVTKNHTPLLYSLDEEGESPEALASIAAVYNLINSKEEKEEEE